MNLLRSLRAFELATATAHGVQLVALVALVLSKHVTKRVPVSVPYVTWPKRGDARQTFGYKTYEDGSIDMSACIVGFFALSWTYQTAAVTLFWPQFQRWLTEYYIQPLRWLEYSISASLMALLFGLLNGITDTSFLYNIFVLFFLTMMLGLVQELGMSVYKRQQQERRNTVDLLRGMFQSQADAKPAFGPPSYDVASNTFIAHPGEDDPPAARRVTFSDDASPARARRAASPAPASAAARARDLDNDRLTRNDLVYDLTPEEPRRWVNQRWMVLFLPHILGWVAFLSPVSVFILKFSLAVSHSPSAPPSWVYFLYSFQFVIMASFAFVQLWQQRHLYLYAQTRAECARVSILAEFAYTTLSLAAKSVLCWVLFANIIAEKGIAYS